MRQIKNKETEAHLRIELKDFVPALERAEKVMNRKNSLPILGDALLQKEGDDFLLTSGNGEHALRQKVGGLVCVDGKFQPMCLPLQDGRSLLTPLKSLPSGGVVQVWVDYSNNSMIIEYVTNPNVADNEQAQGGHYAMTFDAPEEYPATPTMPEKPECRIVMPADWLLKKVKAARVSVANDELRPQFCCVCLDADLEGCTVVSTDGHTLYKDRYEHGVPFLAAGSPAKMLLHNSVLSVLDATFQRQEQITVETDGQKVYVSAPGALLVCATPEQNYPNYNSVIPTGNNKTCTVVVRDMLSALKRVQMFANDSSNMIRLTIAAADSLRLEADDVDFSRSAQETVRILDQQNIEAGFQIGFKASSLAAMLSCIETENAVFSFSSADRAGLINNEDIQSKLTCLCMPMLINQ